MPPPFQLVELAASWRDGSLRGNLLVALLLALGWQLAQDVEHEGRGYDLRAAVVDLHAGRRPSRALALRRKDEACSWQAAAAHQPNQAARSDRGVSRSVPPNITQPRSHAPQPCPVQRTRLSSGWPIMSRSASSMSNADHATMTLLQPGRAGVGLVSKVGWVGGKASKGDGPVEQA